MTKASNFSENRRNRKNHAKSDDRILETAPKQISSDMAMNILLSRNNYLRFGIAYPTGRFYKEQWLVNHENQAALMKSSKNASAVLLRDSIVAGFFQFFDGNTLNCATGVDKVHMGGGGGGGGEKHPSTTIAGVCLNQLWHKQPGYRQF